MSNTSLHSPFALSQSKGYACNTFHPWFDKHVLSIPAVSFDQFRTNGWDVEGLTKCIAVCFMAR